MSIQPLTGRAPSVPAHRPERLSPTAAATAISYVAGMAIPLALLIVLERHGLDFSRPLYSVLLVAIILDSTLMAAAGLTTLRSHRYPPLTDGAPPSVHVAVLAHAATDPAAVSVTVDALRAQQYAGHVHIVVSYAADSPIHALENLHDDQDANRTVQVLRVETPVAEHELQQRALREAHGEVVGFFRAGQEPAPNTVDHACTWIGSGYDAVFGHRAVGNAANSAAARTVAVEQYTADVVRWPPEDEEDAGLSLASCSFWRIHLARLLGNDEAARPPARVVEDRRSVIWEPLSTDRASLRARWTAQETAWMRQPSGHSIPRYAATLPRWLASVWRPGYVWLSFQVPVLTAFWLGWQHVGSHHARDLVPLIVLLAVWLCGNPIIRTIFAYISAPAAEKRAAWFVSYALRSILYLDTVRRTIARAAQVQAVVGRGPAVYEKTVPATQTLPTLDIAPMALATATTDVDATTSVPTDLLQPSAIAAAAHDMVGIASCLTARFSEASQMNNCLELRLTDTRDVGAGGPKAGLADIFEEASLSPARIDVLQKAVQRVVADPESLMALAAVAQHASELLKIVDAVLHARALLQESTAATATTPNTVSVQPAGRV